MKTIIHYWLHLAKKLHKEDKETFALETFGVMTLGVLCAALTGVGYGIFAQNNLIRDVSASMFIGGFFMVVALFLYLCKDDFILWKNSKLYHYRKWKRQLNADETIKEE